MKWSVKKCMYVPSSILWKLMFSVNNTFYWLYHSVFIIVHNKKKLLVDRNTFFWVLYPHFKAFIGIVFQHDICSFACLKQLQNLKHCLISQIPETQKKYSKGFFVHDLWAEGQDCAIKLFSESKTKIHWFKYISGACWWSGLKPPCTGELVMTPSWQAGRFMALCWGEWQSVEGWDLSVSLSGILTALALVCTRTSYMHVSLFTAPASRSPSSTHLSL